MWVSAMISTANFTTSVLARDAADVRAAPAVLLHSVPVRFIRFPAHVIETDECQIAACKLTLTYSCSIVDIYVPLVSKGLLALNLQAFDVS